jgi:cephalosporin hydroxylase
VIVNPEPTENNPLWLYFKNNGEGKSIHKWHHYFDIYHNHFQRFRGQPITILEIGVCHGGSLQMWKDYFGPEARIFGVDINPQCKALEEDQIKIFIGDQEDRGFLKSLKKEVGTIDILIDDGGHLPKQQIATYEELYSSVAENGVYLVEDLHTNYWDHLGGGYRKPGTFIEYAKNFIDHIHAWHSKEDEFQPNELTRTATGIHFYDSVLVIEKHPSPGRPKVSRSGIKPF